MENKKKFFFKKEEVELKDLLSTSEMGKITGGLEVGYSRWQDDFGTYTNSTYVRK